MTNESSQEHGYYLLRAEDEDLKEELDKHLTGLEALSQGRLWSDGTRCREEWDESIMSELRRANVILLLISVTSNASISSGKRAHRGHGAPQRGHLEGGSDSS